MLVKSPVEGSSGQTEILGSPGNIASVFTDGLQYVPPFHHLKV